MVYKKKRILKRVFEVGQTVIMNDQHPWMGHRGKIVAIENVGLKSLGMGEPRPRVKLDNGTECFIMDDFDARIIS